MWVECIVTSPLKPNPTLFQKKKKNAGYVDYWNYVEKTIAFRELVWVKQAVLEIYTITKKNSGTPCLIDQNNNFFMCYMHECGLLDINCVWLTSLKRKISYMQVSHAERMGTNYTTLIIKVIFNYQTLITIRHIW